MAHMLKTKIFHTSSNLILMNHPNESTYIRMWLDDDFSVQISQQPLMEVTS
jgi:hypothetical protein